MFTIEEMEFFQQVRNQTILFIFFGIWSSWQHGKYKWALRAYSVSAIYQEMAIIGSVMYSYDIFKDYTLSATVENSMYMIISWTHLIIVIESLVTSSIQVKLIQKFSQVDHLLSARLKVEIPYTKERRKTFARNFFLLTTIILMKGFVSGYLHYHNKVLVSWYPALYSIWIMCLRTIQIILFAYLMRCRLTVINSELICIQHVFNTHLRTENRRQRASISKIIYHRIKTLKKIYGILYEACELVNKVFGWSLLAITTQCFVDFTFK